MKMFIDGEWVDSSNGNVLKKINPSTGIVMEDFPAGTKDDVSKAIDAAESAFEPWYKLGSKERSKLILKAADMIEKYRTELEHLLMNENGKIAIQAREEVEGALDQIRYYAGFERKITGDVVEGDTDERRIFQYKIPYGVVVALTPWNFPVGMVARKLAPALLTGNTVVLKPSSDTPLTAAWIVRAFADAGFPNGVVNLVTGKGSEIGDFIVSHKKVSLITMTGSTATGQRIMQHATANMAKLILELGGKAPYMVWKDASIENAVRTLIWAKYWNAGQSCIAAERLYVHEDIYEPFMARFLEVVKRLKVGDPKEADIGPLINNDALESAEKFVKDAVENGSKLVFGGGKARVAGSFGKGFYFRPTVMEDIDQESELFQEEIFGPIIGVRKVSNFDEMMDQANDSKYGLASYLFTENQNIMLQAAERIRFGELYVNMPGPESSQGYHTGFRMTGQAGEGSRYGIEEYVKLKNVYVDFSGKTVTFRSFRRDLF
ncbi:MAG: D-glyceraldehyde dehydrogenase [Thermoplasmataceae archaeon]|jgi:D-glyceraldehyde dehydrogenase (NADP+)